MHISTCPGILWALANPKSVNQIYCPKSGSKVGWARTTAGHSSVPWKSEWVARKKMGSKQYGVYEHSVAFLVLCNRPHLSNGKFLWCMRSTLQTNIMGRWMGVWFTTTVTAQGYSDWQGSSALHCWPHQSITAGCAPTKMTWNILGNVNTH